MIEAYLFVMIGGLDEIKKFVKGDESTVTTSAVITCVFISVFVAFTIFTGSHWVYSSRKSKCENKDTHFSELYNDIKPGMKNRTFTTIFLLRRLIIAVFITFLAPILGVNLMLCLYAAIQLVNLGLLCAIRPFESKSDNFVIIKDEFLFFVT